MKTKLTILFFFILISSFAQTQQSWNWYFGSGAALNFSTGNPVAVAGCAMSTTEGCATISDIAGNLMFYTDGITVWNKNNIAMPNGFGLFGDPSSTQSGVIVPHPDSANIYYIFTTTCCMGSNGANYSEVDMTLNAGLGDVTIKNSPLLTPDLEKILAIRHCNGRDFWVLIHASQSDAFYVYLVTQAGVAPPVITNVGINTGSSYLGYMKASPNGKKIAMADAYTGNQDIVQLFDFDNSTGIISNAITISDPVFSGPYGVSFSPDNHLLYFDCEISGALYQYDITSNNQVTINASQYIVVQGAEDQYMALQIAVDGKIYITRYSQNFLAVINNPNVIGAGCNFADNAVSLGAGISEIGLPNFVDAYNVPLIISLAHDTTACPGPVLLDPGSGGSSYLWSTGDTTQTITVNNSGTYWVRITGAATPCDTAQIAYDTINVTITTFIPVNLGPDESICNNQSVTLNAGNPGDTYSWSTGATTQTISVNTPGTYYVLVNNNGCLGHDTIVISPGVLPTVNLGPDSTFCSNQSVTLNAGNTGDQYTWSTGATTQTINVSTAGTFWVNVSNGSCFGTDTVVMNVIAMPTQNLGNDTTICAGQTVTLNAGNPGYNYHWSTGATTQTITVSTAGTYWVIVNQGACTTPDSIHLTIVPAPVVSIGPDSSVCTGQSVVLNAGNPGDTYVWSTGATTQTITATTSGTYTVLVNNGACTGIDTMVLTVIATPNFNIGADTIICIGTSITLDAGNTGNVYHWSNGSTAETITIDSAGEYWVMVNNSKCANADSINIAIDNPAPPNPGNDTVICGNIFTLSAGVTSSHYLWSTGDTTKSIIINAPGGHYWVTINDGKCFRGDSINVSFTNDSDYWAPPNIFTPNGDGKNETFVPGIVSTQNFDIKIFNRWGELMFESTNPYEYWNGLNKGGSACYEGTYYWLATYALGCDPNDIKKDKGYLLLKR